MSLVFRCNCSCFTCVVRKENGTRNAKIYKNNIDSKERTKNIVRCLFKTARNINIELKIDSLEVFSNPEP